MPSNQKRHANNPSVVMVRWKYDTDEWYGYTNSSQEQMGELYGMRVHDPDVSKVKLWYDGDKLLEWSSDNITGKI